MVIVRPTINKVAAVYAGISQLGLGLSVMHVVHPVEVRPVDGLKLSLKMIRRWPSVSSLRASTRSSQSAASPTTPSPSAPPQISPQDLRREIHGRDRRNTLRAENEAKQLFLRRQKEWDRRAEQDWTEAGRRVLPDAPLGSHADMYVKIRAGHAQNQIEFAKKEWWKLSPKEPVFLQEFYKASEKLLGEKRHYRELVAEKGSGYVKDLIARLTDEEQQQGIPVKPAAAQVNYGSGRGSSSSTVSVDPLSSSSRSSGTSSDYDLRPAPVVR